MKNASETVTKTDNATTVTHNLTYAYDMRSQLTDADITNIIEVGNWSADYTYHDNGDMISRTIQSSTTNFSGYNGNLMTGASGGDNFTLDWDKNGQLKLTDQTTGDDTSLVWNWAGKLRSASKGSTTINLKYDADGNRIYKDSGGTARKYIVDIVGGLPVILVELEGSTVKKKYVYANSQILKQYDTDTSADYFYMHDRLGSVRQLIKLDGTTVDVVRLYTYEPFGDTLEDEGTFDNAFMFTGQYFDSEIDEYYLRARQYDPLLYRFTSRDPVLGELKEPMTLHQYLYCQNDPINRIDPEGLWRTGIHNQLTNAFVQEAFPGLPREYIRSMRQGSAYVDSEFQAVEFSFTHAMRAPRQSIEEAERRMSEFVEQHLHNYEFLEFLGTALEDEELLREAICAMFWHRVRLVWSIRGSLVAKTPITGSFGAAFLILGKCTALTFFAIANTPFYRLCLKHASMLNNLVRLFERGSIFEQFSYEVQKLRCIHTIGNFVVYRESQAH